MVACSSWPASGGSLAATTDSSEHQVKRPISAGLDCTASAVHIGLGTAKGRRISTNARSRHPVFLPSPSILRQRSGTAANCQRGQNKRKIRQDAIGLPMLGAAASRGLSARAGLVRLLATKTCWPRRKPKEPNSCETCLAWWQLCGVGLR